MRKYLPILFFIPLVLIWTHRLGDTSESDEVQRLKNHFTDAIAFVESAEVGTLSPAQLKAREETLKWVEEYSERGIYPHKHVSSDGRIPVFVDPHGTPCAVAYLMLRSGEYELVEDIVRASNLATVAELAHDSRVVKWLSERGLSKAEAARIQPSYEPPPEPDPPPLEVKRSPYAEEIVGFAIMTAAITSYSEFLDREQHGFDWTGIMGAAATGGHLYFLGSRPRGHARAPRWERTVNIAGIFVGVTEFILRQRRRAKPPDQIEPLRSVHSFVMPSPEGLTVGVRIRR